MRKLFLKSSQWFAGFFLTFLILQGFYPGNTAQGQPIENAIYIRINQVGYRPQDDKIAIVFSHKALKPFKYVIVDDSTNKTVWGPAISGKNSGDYGNFENNYRLDFSSLKKSGQYKIQLVHLNSESHSFRVGEHVYDGSPDVILKYLRQQRCGYNPFLDEVCHKKDGRTVYGPMPDSTYIDVSGGWHDAGDDLRYMLTSGNTIGRLLFTYKENRGKFADTVNYLGQPFPNGIPDILDEAKWGLDWMLKMHPAPDQLFHQVGDDRDHIGFKYPYKDSSDYGWGPESYRVVYYANGKPQGLGKYKNTSTGIANLAGRYAADMAMAYQIWKNDLNDPAQAEIYLKAGKEVYEMGLKQPGCQEGTPMLASYRYREVTWADDMEWGAAELYRVTNDKRYLKDAKRFAEKANTVSWMGADTAGHYEFYPFMNLGHYELFPLVDQSFQDTLAGYYRQQLEAVYQKALKNPYHIGYPFIWCSNNLASALITQCLLYEKMTGDTKYHQMALEVRDWLLGRNPWGVSQFVGYPHNGVTPKDPHSSISFLTGREITGGMNDGPLFTSTYNVHHIQLRNPDEYAPFQSQYVVYHDDLNDYATNEPTLDGTAEAIYFLTTFAQDKK